MSMAVLLGDRVVGQGFSWRKRRLVRAFTGRADIRFRAAGRAVPAGHTVLLWGSASAPPGAGRIVRLEDGFVRSVGLGADLVLPLSWVIDDVGIYYDASRPSALEQRLQDGSFDEASLERAAALRERIVESGLTKFNLGAPPWQRPTTRQVVLVAGQVETDAAVRFGTTDVRTNIELLQAVRAARPHAWVVYKPHPDVVAGLRRPGSGEFEAVRHCDEIVERADMHDLLQQVDEVHVMSSLAGFEALLRGKPVTCWGQPFYAGWGLTDDRSPPARRTRRLQLDELVCGALIDYAVYLDRRTRTRCSPEQALDSLLEWRDGRPSHDPWWRRWLRPLLARP